MCAPHSGSVRVPPWRLRVGITFFSFSQVRGLLPSLCAQASVLWCCGAGVLGWGVQVQGMEDAAAVRNSRPSIWAEARRIFQEEGVMAFWKGNTVTIVHRLPYSAINFFAYETYKKV